jgi:hypothetical protein
MKKLIAITVAAGLTLAGCNSFNPTTVVTDSTVVATDVANATKLACGFVPAATTIAQILNASNSVLTAAQIAKVICDAVAAQKPAALAHKKATVQPVLILVNDKVIEVHGDFVK